MIKEQVKKLIEDYENTHSNRAKGTALNKISNLLFMNKDNVINEISARFAFFRENGLKADSYAIMRDIELLKNKLGDL